MDKYVIMDSKRIGLHRRVFICAILLPLCWMVLSCSSHQDEAVLQQAEDYLPAHPDSATLCLQDINPDKLNEEHRSWFGLLRTIVDNLQDKKVQTDSLIRPSYEYYQSVVSSKVSTSHDVRHHYAQACLYLGIYLVEVDSLQRALSLFHEAVRHAESIQDYRTAYLAYASISNQLRGENQKGSLDYAKKALDTYRLSQDNEDNLAVLLMNVAIAYQLSYQPELAAEYYGQAYQQALSGHQEHMQRTILHAKASFYHLNHQIPEALQCIHQAVAIPDSANTDNLYLTMANCYLEADSLTAATEALSHINIPKNDIDAYCVYLPLCKIAIRKHEASAAEQYLDSVQSKLEKIYYKQVAVKNDYYQDNLQKARQNEKLTYQSRLRAYIIAIILFVIILIVHFFVTHIRYERKKRELIACQRKQEQETSQREREMQEEKMRQAESTLSILRKYVMNHVDIVQRLKGKEEVHLLTNSDWNDIEVALDGMYNNFSQRLRSSYPQMKESDFHFCLLVRLKLSNPSIGQIYSIGVSAVQKRKQRIKKDIFLLHDPNTTCEQFIEQL